MNFSFKGSKSENESDVASRWVHGESNLMFILSSDKDQRKNSHSFSLSVNESCARIALTCLMWLYSYFLEDVIAGGGRSLLVVYFVLPLNYLSEWSPMERRAPAQWFVTRPVSLRSLKNRNDTNTVSIGTICVYCISLFYNS